MPIYIILNLNLFLIFSAYLEIGSNFGVGLASVWGEFGEFGVGLRRRWEHEEGRLRGK